MFIPIKAEVHPVRGVTYYENADVATSDIQFVRTTLFGISYPIYEYQTSLHDNIVTASTGAITANMEIDICEVASIIYEYTEPLYSDDEYDKDAAKVYYKYTDGEKKEIKDYEITKTDHIIQVKARDMEESFELSYVKMKSLQTSLNKPVHYGTVITAEDIDIVATYIDGHIKTDIEPLEFTKHSVTTEETVRIRTTFGSVGLHIQPIKPDTVFFNDAVTWNEDTGRDLTKDKLFLEYWDGIVEVDVTAFQVQGISEDDEKFVNEDENSVDAEKNTTDVMGDVADKKKIMAKVDTRAGTFDIPVAINPISDIKAIVEDVTEYDDVVFENYYLTYQDRTTKKLTNEEVMLQSEQKYYWRGDNTFTVSYDGKEYTFTINAKQKLGVSDLGVMFDTGLPIPHYIQKSGNTCGAACLDMVEAYLTNREVRVFDNQEWFNGPARQAGYSNGIGSDIGMFTQAAKNAPDGNGGIYQVAQEAYIRGGGLNEAERQRVVQAVAEGHPVIILISNANNPIISSNGHYIVIRGVSPEGGLYINDPAESYHPARAGNLFKSHDVNTLFDGMCQAFIFPTYGEQ